METKDILKWGVVAVAAWWLMGRLNNQEAAAVSGTGLAPRDQTGVQPENQTQSPLITVSEDPNPSLPRAAGLMASLVSPGTTLNFDAWNYYYQQVTGNPGPAPETIGIQRTEHMPNITLAQWIAAVQGQVDLSGLRGFGRLFSALQYGRSGEVM